MDIIHINATTISDAWFQTVYKCIEEGRSFKIEEGSYKGQKRLEFDYITIHIKYPEMEPILPKIPTQYNLPNPVDDNYLVDYIPYLMTGEVKDGESYTYGQRLNKYSIKRKYVEYLKEKILVKNDIDIWNNSQIIIEGKNKEIYLNQIELAIWTYKNKGYRNNQLTLQVGHPTDMLLNDPPCLRHIDTRIQDNKLHFYIYFRSWDLWGGFPANLAGLEYVKQYMASEIGVNNGEMICSSKGLHLYDYTWELAEIIRGKTINQFKGK